MSEGRGKHYFFASGEPTANDVSDRLQLPRSQVWVEKSREFEGVRAKYVEIFRRLANEAPQRTDWPERLRAVATEAETIQKASSLIQKDRERWKGYCGEAVDAMRDEFDRLARLSLQLDFLEDQEAWARDIQRPSQMRVGAGEGDWQLRERLIDDLAEVSQVAHNGG